MVFLIPVKKYPAKRTHQSIFILSLFVLKSYFYFKKKQKQFSTKYHIQNDAFFLAEGNRHNLTSTEPLLPEQGSKVTSGQHKTIGKKNSHRETLRSMTSKWLKRTPLKFSKHSVYFVDQYLPHKVPSVVKAAVT